MKKRGIIVIAVTGLVGVGLMAGTVMANGGPIDGLGDTMPARVAEILGIEQDRVEDAFQQARRDIADETLQARLDKLVENEVITQEQADEYAEWFESRPEIEGVDGPFGKHLMHGFGGFGDGNHLERLVEAAVITEEEAAEVQAWLEARPEGLTLGLVMPGGRGHGFHGFHGGRGHGFGMPGFGPGMRGFERMVPPAEATPDASADAPATSSSLNF
jgi:hypothetical protein